MSNTTEKVTKTNRHYGEGSIYQHKDGRWVAKYRDEAMAKPQYLYGSTEAEVRRKLRDWKKQTARGLTACKKVFFRDYADNWFYTFKQHSVENSSFDRYESIYLHHTPASSLYREWHQNGRRFRTLAAETEHSLLFLPA